MNPILLFSIFLLDLCKALESMQAERDINWMLSRPNDTLGKWKTSLSFTMCGRWISWVVGVCWRLSTIFVESFIFVLSFFFWFPLLQFISCLPTETRAQLATEQQFRDKNLIFDSWNLDTHSLVCKHFVKCVHCAVNV